MINNFTLFFGRFLLLTLFQVIILNNINFSGYLNPFLYIYFVLLLPFDFPRWLMLILALAMGFFIDVFTNTLGLHMSATVFIAYLRPYIIRFLTKQTPESGQVPSINEMGFKWFLYYALLITLVHHGILFYLEAFGSASFFKIAMKVIFSSTFTLILIVITQMLFANPKK